MILDVVKMVYRRVNKGFTLVCHAEHSLCHPELPPCHPELPPCHPEFISGSDRRRGFTLAEVLITLAIIGVVAALTIPAIVRNYQETQRKSAVKKAYSTLVRVTNLVMHQNGGDMTTTPPSKSLDNVSLYYMDMYKKHIPYTKECVGINACANAGVWHNNKDWFNRYGDSVRGRGGTFYCAALTANDGTLWRFYFYSPTCTYGGADICGSIHFDMNGFKKPNTANKDIFHFYIYKNGKVSTGSVGKLIKE